MTNGPSSNRRQLSPSQQPEAGGVSPQPSGRPGSVAPVNKLLIVEDDPIASGALCTLIRASGYTVECAATIAAALPMIDRTIDAIILDLMLPDGDGIAILERVRATGHPARVIVTTGVSASAWLDRVRQLKPHIILKKPIDLSALLAQLV